MRSCASRNTQPKNLPAEGLPIWKITNPVYRDPEYHAEYIRLIADLMVLAFQTDTTRVVTLAVGDDGASFPGVVTVGWVCLRASGSLTWRRLEPDIKEHRRGIHLGFAFGPRIWEHLRQRRPGAWR